MEAEVSQLQSRVATLQADNQLLSSENARLRGKLTEYTNWADQVSALRTTIRSLSDGLEEDFASDGPLSTPEYIGGVTAKFGLSPPENELLGEDRLCSLSWNIYGEPAKFTNIARKGREPWSPGSAELPALSVLYRPLRPGDLKNGESASSILTTCLLGSEWPGPIGNLARTELLREATEYLKPLQDNVIVPDPTRIGADFFFMYLMDLVYSTIISNATTLQAIRRSGLDLPPPPDPR